MVCKENKTNAQIASSQANDENSSITNNSTPNSSSSFSCKGTFNRLIYIDEKPKQKSWGYPKACNKIQIKNKVKRKLRRRRKELNEDEKIWLIEFLSQSDIGCTSLSHKDHVYFGKLNDERKYKHRQYLLWLCVIFLLSANSNAGCEQSFETRCGKEFTFLQLYNFLKPH